MTSALSGILRAILNEGRMCVGLALLLFVSLMCSAQTRLKVGNPYERGGQLDVLDLIDGFCLVDAGYGSEMIEPDRYSLGKSEKYAEGYLEMNRPRKFVTLEGGNMIVQVNMAIMASRPFRDCFVVLHICGYGEQEYLMPQKIPDFSGDGVENVRARFEVPGKIEVGYVGYYFYSGGEEMYYALTEENLKRVRPDQTTWNTANLSRPKLDTRPERKLTKSLAKSVSGDEVVVAIAVNDGGFSVEHVVLEATSSQAEQLAVDLIKQSHFQPAALNGRFVKQDMLLQVAFDEFGEYKIAALQ